MTNKAKHTPGPWKAIKPTGEPWAVQSPTGYKVVQNIYNTDGHNTDEPNARLIAAAPDLLAALEFCADALNTEAGGLYKAHIEQARAAIAKAKGE